MRGKNNKGPVPTLTFAVRDGPAAARQRVQSALTDAASVRLRIVDEKPGFDPYNSGSFDRKHSWARTGRR
jgi:hypothetical protein